MAKENMTIKIIEIVISVIVFAILIVTVVPRYYHQITYSRVQVINKITNDINSMVSVTVAQYRISHNTSKGKGYTNIMLSDVKVSVKEGTGYPAASGVGIGRLLPTTTGFTVTYTPPIATYDFFLKMKNCFVTYNELTGKAVATISGC